MLSPSGKIRIKHWRHDNEDDGVPLRRIALESAANSAAFSILFEHRRSADVMISPDDQYLVVNNHPGSSGGGGQLYRQVTAEPPHYVVAAGFQGEGQELQDRAWAFYLTATGRKPTSDRDHVLINAKAWSPDSRTITLRIVGVGSNNDRSVPSPWESTFDIGTQQFRALSPSNNPGTVAATTLPGERHPETRTRLLKIEDIQTLTDDRLRYAINEMFARRGADFRDKDIKKIFSKFPWYRPVAGKSYEAAEADFTPIEEQNLKLLGGLRDQSTGRPRQTLPGAPPMNDEGLKAVRAAESAKWVGGWSGDVVMEQTASGRGGRFRYAVFIDPNLKSGRMAVDGDPIPCTVSTSGETATMRGSHSRGAQVMTMTAQLRRHSSSVATVFVESQIGKSGGWSKARGTLRRN